MSFGLMPASTSTEVAVDPLKRAVLYVLVSTSRQAARNGEAEGYSIPAQRSAERAKDRLPRIADFMGQNAHA